MWKRCRGRRNRICRCSRRRWTSASRFRRAPPPPEVITDMPLRFRKTGRAGHYQTGEVTFLPPEAAEQAIDSASAMTAIVFQ